VTTDLKDFEWIVPCGIDDRTVTSLEMESQSPDLGTNLALQTAAERVARQFGRVFNSQVLWVESLDALAPVRIESQVQA
jgi:lipoyl(octanoyl) transferase